MGNKNYSVNIGGNRTLDPNGQTWTPAAVSKLGVKIDSQIPAGGAIKIRGVSVTPNTAVKPLVKNLSVAPSNTFVIDTTSNSTTNYSVNWDFYDPDGTPQIGYQVYIFPDNVVSDPAVLPDTSKALVSYSSPTSDATSFAISSTHGYLDGFQYWAYVSVTKKIAGKPTYSEYASASFTVNIVQPQQPIVAVKADSAMARNAISIQSTDNLFSTNTSSFNNSQSSWNPLSSDTATTKVGIAVSAAALATASSTTAPISNLPIGATGGLASTIASSGTGSFVVTGSADLYGTTPSHITFTGNISKGSATITGISLSDYNKIITEIAVNTDGNLEKSSVLWASGIAAGTVIQQIGQSGAGTFFSLIMSNPASVTASGTSIVANYLAGADAVGFPRSGQFWVQIDSERLLVENQFDGNNTGDTFNIIQRGYLSTATASHSIGANVYYGLQNDIYAGYAGEIVQAYDKAVGSTSSSTHSVVVRAGSSGTSVFKSETAAALRIAKSSNGKVISSNGKTIWVNDPNGILRAGSQIDVRAEHDLTHHGLNVSTGQYNLTFKEFLDATATVVSVTAAGTPVLNWQQIATTQYDINWATGQTLDHMRVIAVGSSVKLAKGETLLITTPNSYTIPGTSNTQPAGHQFIVTVSENGKTGGMQRSGEYTYSGVQSTIHIKPIKTAGPYTVKNGFGTYIPQGSIIHSYKSVASAIVKVNLNVSLNQGAFKGSYLKKGDSVAVNNVVVDSGVGASAAVTAPATTYSHSSTAVGADFTQNFTVDYNPNAYPITNVLSTLGNWNGSTFTALSSSGTTAASFNALEAPTSQFSGTFTAYTVAVQGAPKGTIATVSGTSGSNTIFSLSSTGTQPLADGSGTYYVTSELADFFPPNFNLISATATALPVQALPIDPIFPTTNYLRHTSVNVYNDPKYGDYSMLATASVSGTMNIGIYNGTPWTADNSIPVNAGNTYGFALAGQALTTSGTATPLLSLYIDWYDTVGNLLKTSDGTESLTTPGTFRSGTFSVPLGEPMTQYSGWQPNAIAAVAPVITLASSATYSASGGYFTLPSNSNPSLMAGSTVYVGNTVATISVSASASATTLYVLFPNAGKPADMTTASLIVKATSACPRFGVSNVSPTDGYSFCGFMFKALTPQQPSSDYTIINSQLPALTASVSVSASDGSINAFTIPKVTPTSGGNTIYLFDPANDNGTREVHFGTGKSNLSTTLTTSASAGATTVPMNDTTGLGVGSTVVVGNTTDNIEEVVVSSTWDGAKNLVVTAPLLNNHATGEVATAYTTGIGDGFINSQSQNTPVAVFNWNNAGYINSTGSYRYLVERSEDGGNTFTTIYGGNNVSADPNGALTVYDIEVTPGTNVETTYRITPSFIPPSSTTPIIGSPAQNLVAPTLTTNTWWLSSTSNPDLRYPINVQNALEETQKHPVGVFYPLGSSRPIIISGVVQGRDAKITFIWTDIPNWDNLISLLNSGETLILTDPVEGLKRYIALNDDVTVTHNSGGAPYRTVEISYVEAPPPTGWYYNFGQ